MGLLSFPGAGDVTLGRFTVQGPGKGGQQPLWGAVMAAILLFFPAIQERDIKLCNTETSTTQQHSITI